MAIKHLPANYKLQAPIWLIMGQNLKEYTKPSLFWETKTPPPPTLAPTIRYHRYRSGAWGPPWGNPWGTPRAPCRAWRRLGISSPPWAASKALSSLSGEHRGLVFLASFLFGESKGFCKKTPGIGVGGFYVAFYVEMLPESLYGLVGFMSFY